MKLVQRARQRAKEATGFAADLIGAVLTSGGTGLAVVTGKFMFAAVLAAVAFGFFLSLFVRRQVVARSFQPPGWVKLVSGIAAVAASAAMVEATNLPVRFTEAGFQYQHWALALVFAYVVFVAVYRLLCVGIRRTIGNAHAP